MRSKDEFQNLELDSGKRSERPQKVYSYSKNETEQSLEELPDPSLEVRLLLAKIAAYQTAVV